MQPLTSFSFVASSEYWRLQFLPAKDSQMHIVEFPQSGLVRFIAATLYLCCIGAITMPERSFAQELKPNVIMILTDDQGTIDAGCYGSADIQTPAIDRLSKRGVTFTQFYAAAPVCSPSRAALLTGRYPRRAGLVGNAASQPGGEGMPASQVTIAEIMKANGYATAHIGKWHLGYRPDLMPNAQGFDYSFGHMGGCIDNYSHFYYWSGPNRHDLYRNGKEVFHYGEFFPDLMVKEAASFMEKNKDNPFFIYFAINAPHYPYQPDQKWLEHYKELPHPRNLYAAFVSTMDERVGKLLKYVDDLGLRERTIVTFQSDHGHSVEERAHFAGGSAGRYRGAKFSLFEGGIRVPAIISWPSKLPEGAIRGQIGHSCDWLPTIVELCKLKPLGNEMDGMSLLPIIQSPSAPSPHSVIHWQVGQGDQAQWAVREGDWKLIGNVNDPTSDKGALASEDKKLFLANLRLDSTEQSNFALKETETVTRLLKLRQEWVKQVEREEGKTRGTDHR